MADKNEAPTEATTEEVIKEASDQVKADIDANKAAGTIGEEVAAKKVADNKEFAKQAALTEPQVKTLRNNTASQNSLLAQRRRVVDPTAVGNEYVQVRQDDTGAVESTPDSSLSEDDGLVQRNPRYRAPEGVEGEYIKPKGKTRKFTVRGANIHTAEGKKEPGDTVELTAAEFKHYNALGLLDPTFDEE